MEKGKLADFDEVMSLLEARERACQPIDFDEFAAFLKSKVKGQDVVIDGVSRELRQRMKRIGDPDRKGPIGVFCFIGPPAVGKTYLACLIGERIFDGRNPLHEFSMDVFAEEYTELKLLGVPKGYHGHGSYGQLGAVLTKTPECVIVLDQFEKAHPRIQETFLTAFHSGSFLDAGTGEIVSLKNAIFILTTNVQTQKIGELTARFPNPTRREEDEVARAANLLLKGAGWSPELVDRFDQTYAFSQLSGAGMVKLICIEILRISGRFGMRVAEKGIDPLVIVSAVKRGKDLGGIRPLARALEREVSDGLSAAREAGLKEVRFVAGEGFAIHVVPAGEVGASPATAPSQGRHP